MYTIVQWLRGCFPCLLLFLASQTLLCPARDSIRAQLSPALTHTIHPPSPCCLPQVSEGSGKILVVAVGDNSEWGKTISLVTSSGDEQTPLQEKLAHVAATVGKIGASVAATCFIALLVRGLGCQLAASS
jgi:hypothetical protein